MSHTSAFISNKKIINIITIKVNDFLFVGVNRPHKNIKNLIINGQDLQ